MAVDAELLLNALRKLDIQPAMRLAAQPLAEFVFVAAVAAIVVPMIAVLAGYSQLEHLATYPLLIGSPNSYWPHQLNQSLGHTNYCTLLKLTK